VHRASDCQRLGNDWLVAIVTRPAFPLKYGMSRKPSASEEAARRLREGGTLVDVLPRDEAIKCLEEGGSLGRLLAAVSGLRADPAARAEDLLPGRRYPAVIREAAAFALYNRTQRKLPADLMLIDQDEASWREFLRRGETDVDRDAGTGPSESRLTGPIPERSAE